MTNVSGPEMNMLKNSSTLAISVPINLSIKLGFFYIYCYLEILQHLWSHRIQGLWVCTRRLCISIVVQSMFHLLSSLSPPLWSKWQYACLSCSAPGFDPRSGQVSWVRFFRGFSSPVRQMSGSFRPTRSPYIIWPSLSSILIHYGRQ